MKKTKHKRQKKLVNLSKKEQNLMDQIVAIFTVCTLIFTPFGGVEIPTHSEMYFFN